MPNNELLMESFKYTAPLCLNRGIGGRIEGISCFQLAVFHRALRIWKKHTVHMSIYLCEVLATKIINEKYHDHPH